MRLCIVCLRRLRWKRRKRFHRVRAVTSSSARFIIENARVTRVNRRDKVTFLSVAVAGFKAGSVAWYDVTYFVSNAVEDPTKWDGKSVTIKGDIETRPPLPSDANRKWTVQLIARSIEPGDESLTVAMPVKAGRKPAQAIGLSEADDVPF